MKPRTFSLRYRPQDFDELFDQEHVKRTLINAIERNRLAHAYLFTGPRGVGKTTTARILAKSLNCTEGPTIHPCNKCSACLEITASKSLDVLEIDGASNRGIDQIRELRENVRYRPTGGHYRIYIIDEVHMLTPEAFNALLKTLEEPPAHVIFIFATTEPHKVPPTILSRCQRFDFKRIAPETISERLMMIIEKEKLDVEPDAIKLIADIADGGLRDAESVLEQITTFKEGRVAARDVTELLGIVPCERFSQLLELVRNQDETAVLQLLEETFAAGYDVSEFYFGMIGFLRALLFSSLGMKTTNSAIPEPVLKRAERYKPKQLAGILQRFLKSEEAFKRSREKVIFIETLALALLDTGDANTLPPSSPSSLPSSSTKPQPPGPSSEPPEVTTPSSTPTSRPEKTKTSPAENIQEQSASPVEEKPDNQPGAKSKEPAPEESTEGKEKSTEEDEEPTAGHTALKDAWGRFIKEIGTEHSFVTLALKNSEVMEVRNNLLRIGITNHPEFNVGRLEAEQSHLEERFSGIAGQKVRLEFKAARQKNKGTKPEKPKTSSAVEDVLDIFKGEIIR